MTLFNKSQRNRLNLSGTVDRRSFPLWRRAVMCLSLLLILPSLLAIELAPTAAGAEVVAQPTLACVPDPDAPGTNVSSSQVEPGLATGLNPGDETGWVNGRFLMPSTVIERFQGANAVLQNVDLEGAYLQGADLRGADLRGANLRHAHFTQPALISKAESVGVKLGAKAAIKAGIDKVLKATAGTKRSAQLSFFTRIAAGGITDLALGEGGLADPNLPAADLSGADLRGADLSGAILVGVNLSGANLSGADLSGALLVGADLSGATINPTAEWDDWIAPDGGAPCLQPLESRHRTAATELYGVRSGDMAANPAPTLPTGWAFIEGHLVGPGADLSNRPVAPFSLRDFVDAGTSADCNADSLASAGLSELAAAARSGANNASTCATAVVANIISVAEDSFSKDAPNLAGLKLGPVDLSGASETAFSGVSLVGADMSNANFSGTDLSGVDLTDAVLTGTNLNRVNLTGATLTDADLSTASLLNTTFTNADLGGALLAGTSLVGVRSGGLRGIPASLPDWWTAGNGYLIGPGADLTGADLSGLDLAGVFLDSVDLSNVNLSGVDLQGTTLSGADLRGTRSGPAGIEGIPIALPAGWQLVDGYLLGPGADMSRMNLSGFNLSQLDLRGVRSGGITGQPSALPTGWRLRGGYLAGPGADLTGAALGGVDLSGADLTGVRSGGITGEPSALPSGWQLHEGLLFGPGADLHGEDLSGMNLSGFDLTGASLRDVDLRNANISGTVLTNADLYGVVSGSPGVSAHGGSVIGEPIGLTKWRVVNGYVIGPGARPTGAVADNHVDLAGANLNGVCLDGARIGRLAGTLPSVGDCLGGVYSYALMQRYVVGPQAYLPGANLDCKDNGYTSNVDAEELLRGFALFISGKWSQLKDVTARQWDFPTNLNGAVLRGAYFNQCNMNGLSLSGADFTGATAVAGSWGRSNPGTANFTNADFSRSQTLAYAVLRGTILDGINIKFNSKQASIKHFLANLGAYPGGDSCAGFGWIGQPAGNCPPYKEDLDTTPAPGEEIVAKSGKPSLIERMALLSDIKNMISASMPLTVERSASDPEGKKALGATDIDKTANVQINVWDAFKEKISKYEQAIKAKLDPLADDLKPKANPDAATEADILADNDAAIEFEARSEWSAKVTGLRSELDAAEAAARTRFDADMAAIKEKYPFSLSFDPESNAANLKARERATEDAYRARSEAFDAAQADYDQKRSALGSQPNYTRVQSQGSWTLTDRVMDLQSAIQQRIEQMGDDAKQWFSGDVPDEGKSPYRSLRKVGITADDIGNPVLVKAKLSAYFAKVDLQSGATAYWRKIVERFAPGLSFEEFQASVLKNPHDPSRWGKVKTAVLQQAADEIALPDSSRKKSWFRNLFEDSPGRPAQTRFSFTLDANSTCRSCQEFGTFVDGKAAKLSDSIADAVNAMNARLKPVNDYLVGLEVNPCGEVPAATCTPSDVLANLTKKVDAAGVDLANGWEAAKLGAAENSAALATSLRSWANGVTDATTRAYANASAAAIEFSDAVTNAAAESSQAAIDAVTLAKTRFDAAYAAASDDAKRALSTMRGYVSDAAVAMADAVQGVPGAIDRAVAKAGDAATTAMSSAVTALNTTASSAQKAIYAADQAGGKFLLAIEQAAKGKLADAEKAVTDAYANLQKKQLEVPVEKASAYVRAKQYFSESFDSFVVAAHS
ncbi:MAG: hypothetical protein F2877_00720, partial [Actinobacteria bacterium]|nr:hypothetical protein [Actinomycetota bacterium]